MTDYRRTLVLVRVDGFHGVESCIWTAACEDDEDLPYPAEDGKPVYCVGRLDENGQVELIDYGYRSPAEAGEAWERDWKERI